MRELKIESLSLSIFADELEEVTEGKWRIYDSKGRYMDYYEIETLEELAGNDGLTVQEQIDKICDDISKASSLLDLLDNQLSLCYSLYEEKDITELLKKITEESEKENFRDMSIMQKKAKLEENEWVNIVGKFFIFVYDI